MRPRCTSHLRDPVNVRALASRISSGIAGAKLLGLPLPDLDGRYQLERILGEGAFGVAVRAYDNVLDRRVVLKLSPTGADPTRVVSEGRALARFVRVKHVVRVIDANQGMVRCRQREFPVVFLMLEYVDGSSLRAWLENQARPYHLVVSAFAQVAAGLAEVHAQGLVHGDVKTENVVVETDGAIRLIDFGFAVPISRPDAKAPGTPIAGTLAYMAPEAKRGGARRRSDVFSLAVCIWESLTGAHPIGVGNDPTLRWWGSVATMRCEHLLHPDLRELLRRALHPIPAVRPTSAEMAEGLYEHARHAHDAAMQKPSRWGRFGCMALILLACVASAWTFSRFRAAHVERFATRIGYMGTYDVCDFSQGPRCPRAVTLSLRPDGLSRTEAHLAVRGRSALTGTAVLRESCPDAPTGCEGALGDAEHCLDVRMRDASRASSILLRLGVVDGNVRGCLISEGADAGTRAETSAPVVLTKRQR